MENINIKLCNFEKMILDFLRKHINIIIIILVSILALIVRRYCINFISSDYTKYLSIWFNKMKEIGSVSALKEQIGNYNELYMWIMYFLTKLPLNSLLSIKLVSILFDFIGAMSSSILVYTLLKRDKNRMLYSILTYIIILFSPIVVLNSAVWGQCDFIYTTFIILSLILLMKEKYFMSFVLLGVAFALKLQFIFILPVFVLVYISRHKFPIYYFLIPIVINILFCFPSIIVGKPFIQCMSVYFTQGESYSSALTLNFPNVYNLLGLGENLSIIPTVNGIDFSKIGIIVTLLIFIIMFYIVFKKKIYLSNELILDLSIWAVLVCTCFLPHMHDRYMFVADVLSIAFFMIYRKRIYVPLIINFVSFSAYIRYLFGDFFLSCEIIAFINVVFVIIFSVNVFKKVISNRSEIDRRICSGK